MTCAPCQAEAEGAPAQSPTEVARTNERDESCEMIGTVDDLEDSHDDARADEVGGEHGGACTLQTPDTASTSNLFDFQLLIFGQNERS